MSKFTKVMEKCAEILNKEVPNSWCLFSDSSLLARGMKLDKTPDDLEIVFKSKEDMKKGVESLKDFKTVGGGIGDEPELFGHLEGYIVSKEVDGVGVDLLSEANGYISKVKTPIECKIEEVEFEGKKFPVISLEEALKFYKALIYDDKIALVENKLKE